jgi:hypothetical protein
VSCTFGILNSLHSVIRVIGVSLNMNKSSDMLRDFELQFDHLSKQNQNTISGATSLLWEELQKSPQRVLSLEYWGILIPGQWPKVWTREELSHAWVFEAQSKQLPEYFALRE